MDLSEKVSEKCIVFISKYTNKTEEEMQIIQYGVQSIIINVVKLLILFIVAYFLKVLSYTFIAFISFGVVRTFAGGVHADSGIKCEIVNFITFFGNVYVSKLVRFNQLTIVCMFIVSSVLILTYAPADTYERPLPSAKLRKQLKIRSLSAVVLLFVVVLLLQDSIYAKIVTIAVLEETFLITPIAYKIFYKSYNNYQNLTD